MPVPIQESHWIVDNVDLNVCVCECLCWLASGLASSPYYRNRLLNMIVWTRGWVGVGGLHGIGTSGEGKWREQQAVANPGLPGNMGPNLTSSTALFKSSDLRTKIVRTFTGARELCWSDVLSAATSGSWTQGRVKLLSAAVKGERT